MTAGEAIALALALIQAARAAGTGDPPRHTAASCPPWCAYPSHTCEEGIHLGESHAVPVVAHHHCCYTRPGPFAVEDCGEDLCAALTLSDDGYPEVAIHHGDDCLPNMTLSAAEAHAEHLLGLVITGRNAAPAA